MPVTIEEARRDPVMVLQVGGRIDAASSPVFEEAIDKKLEDASVDNMVLDCKDLGFLSSAGLRVILKTVKTLKGRSGRLFMCNLSDSIAEVLRISGFASFIEIEAGPDDCLAHFGT